MVGESGTRLRLPHSHVQAVGGLPLPLDCGEQRALHFPDLFLEAALPIEQLLDEFAIGHCLKCQASQDPRTL
jgi:hypothetical protein